MKRRTLVGSIAAAAAAAAAAAPGHAPRRIGMSDVDRLQHRFAEIIASDHRHGGQRGIEQRAAALADEALNLQNSGSATQRVRNSLYACAASFRSSAMWAAIDGRRYDDAKAHMREAQALAEMSGDQAIKFRIWSHAGAMYRHMGRPADALAANDVARNLHITRRDPMFASLGLARQAAIHGAAQDRNGTSRAYNQAQDAMERADSEAHRPVWLLAFYDQAELDSLALSAHLALGDYPTAEFHAHRCLANLRPHMVRSRAITTTRLAHAQLAQGDAEAATATALKVPATAATQHARVSRMLQEFGAALRATAPGSPPVHTWTEHTAAWRTSA
jgi:tetratricopeptide (TPR) repeat protein